MSVPRLSPAGARSERDTERERERESRPGQGRAVNTTEPAKSRQAGVCANELRNGMELCMLRWGQKNTSASGRGRTRRATRARHVLCCTLIALGKMWCKNVHNRTRKKKVDREGGHSINHIMSRPVGAGGAAKPAASVAPSTDAQLLLRRRLSVSGAPGVGLGTRLDHTCLGADTARAFVRFSRCVSRSAGRDRHPGNEWVYHTTAWQFTSPSTPLHDVSLICFIFSSMFWGVGGAVLNNERRGTS